jgi:hypothetical protein
MHETDSQLRKSPRYRSLRQPSAPRPAVSGRLAFRGTREPGAQALRSPARCALTVACTPTPHQVSPSRASRPSAHTRAPCGPGNGKRGRKVGVADSHNRDTGDHLQHNRCRPICIGPDRGHDAAQPISVCARDNVNTSRSLQFTRGMSGPFAHVSQRVVTRYGKTSADMRRLHGRVRGDTTSRYRKRFEGKLHSPGCPVPCTMAPQHPVG